MANVMMRPLIQWPRWHRHCFCYYRPAFYHSQASSNCPKINRCNRLLLIDSPPISLSSYTHIRCFRSHALKPRNVPLPLDSAESYSDSYSDSDSSDSSSRKSRNKKKREAKRAVKWAMELSDFSPLQIKRILSAASLDETDDVYEAILLVKRFGRDVKEGKRRQYNYIGRLLREADADAELMDGLIQATKDKDENKFRNLSGPEVASIEDYNNKQVEETDDDDDESEAELTQDQTDLVTRWMDGLINRDVQIMNDIYSLQHVDFDRQELRRLVRKVHSAQEIQVITTTLEKEKGEQVVVAETTTIATRSLNRFLRDIVKHLSVE